MFPSRLRAGRLPRRGVLRIGRLGPPSAWYIFADRPERWSPSSGSEQAKVRQLPGPRLQQDTERLVRQRGGSPKKPISRDTQTGRTRADRRSGVSIAVLRAMTSFSAGGTEGFAGEPRRKLSSLLVGRRARHATVVCGLAVARPYWRRRCCVSRARQRSIRVMTSTSTNVVSLSHGIPTGCTAWARLGFPTWSPGLFLASVEVFVAFWGLTRRASGRREDGSVAGRQTASRSHT